ncbi:MAG: nucleotidyltransferase family protein [Aestuariibacter sp.]|jgi:hypothetical protein|nr:nucleotidyltransferase family protein [Aestuariibacter sp.]MCP5017439.1 nucleotidyltransferase family protein [Ketobacter sp.]
MHRLITLMQKDEERMEILSIVRSLELVDCYVAAGFVRNLVWDWLHGIRTPVNDVDIVFFDNTDSRNLSATKHQAALMAAYPAINWDVKNQAHMHHRNNDIQYKNTLDAMSYWPEKETAVGARLDNENNILIVSAFGLDGLFRGTLTYNSKRSKQIFHSRVCSKNWLNIWPKLQVVL